MSTSETPESSPSVLDTSLVDGNHKEFQSSVSDIARQSSVSFLGTSSTLVIGYVFRIYLARTLGARLLGANALCIGLYALFRMVGDLGLPYAAGRYVAVYESTGQTERLRSFFWRAFLWTMAGSCLLSLALIGLRERLANQFFHDPELAGYIPFYALLIPIGAASSFLLQTLTGLKKVSRRMFITHFVSIPFMMLATVVAVSLGFSLRGYVIAQILGESIALVLAAWSIRRHSSAPLRLSDIPGGRLQPEVWWFALALLAMSFLEYGFSRADRLILGHYLQTSQIGIYAVASSAAGLCAMVLLAVNSIFGPVIADLHARKEHRLLLRLFQTLTKWVIALTVPLILVLSVFSGTVMSVFGPEFEAGSIVLTILSLGQLANVGTGPVGTLLYMSGNQNKMLPVQAVAAGVALTANIVLIPLLGVKAAAVVSVFGHIITNVFFLWLVRRKMQLFPYNRSYFRLIVPLAATGATIWLLHAKATVLSPVPLLVLVSMIAYAVFLVLVVGLGLTDDDRVVVQLVHQRLKSLFSARGT